MHPLPSVPAALARRQSVGGWLVVLPAVRVSITASHCVLYHFRTGYEGHRRRAQVPSPSHLIPRRLFVSLRHVL